jgi:hypothetical protein
MFDKATGRYRALRPKDIAYVEGLYDLDHPILARTAVERLLSNIESCAAPAFRLLASQGVEALSDEQREEGSVPSGTVRPTKIVRAPDRDRFEEFCRR